MGTNVIKNIFITMRPWQWSKNVFIFTALVFSKNFFKTNCILSAILGFISFCLISSSVYIFNDIIDRKRDKEHPEKAKRPIAKGDLSLGNALISMIIVLLLGFLVAYYINIYFMLTALIYVVLQILYSFYLKHIVIIDIFSIASGFFLRVIAGAYAINVPISSWLLICTFFISLFIALSKRRHEIVLLDISANEHRRVFDDYNTLLLDQMISVVTSGTVVSYSVYTLSEETIKRFGTQNLKYTIPFVLFGIYRYLYIVYLRKEGGSPETILVKDMPFRINMLLYILTLLLVLYYI